MSLSPELSTAKRLELEDEELPLFSTEDDVAPSSEDVFPPATDVVVSVVELSERSTTADVLLIPAVTVIVITIPASRKNLESFLNIFYFSFLKNFFTYTLNAN
jgi:hypothetical protein